MTEHTADATGPAPPYSSTMSAAEKEIQVPEWDHVNAASAPGAASKPTFRSGFNARFNRIMPPHRRYLRMKRGTFLLVLAGVIVALVGLIVGLTVGLIRPSNNASAADIPLPSNSNIFTGDLTYYDPGLGACGVTSTSADYVVAVSESLFDAAGSSSSTGGNSNDNPLCGRMLRAQRYDDSVGKNQSITLTVVDRCTGCALYDLDTTSSAFDDVAEQAQGRVTVEWAWL